MFDKIALPFLLISVVFGSECSDNAKKCGSDCSRNFRNCCEKCYEKFNCDYTKDDIDECVNKASFAAMSVFFTVLILMLFCACLCSFLNNRLVTNEENNIQPQNNVHPINQTTPQNTQQKTVQDETDSEESFESCHSTINNADYNVNITRFIDNFTDCSICLERLVSQNRQKPLIILSCSHSFHKNCIEEWFVNSKKCPLCRN